MVSIEEIEKKYNIPLLVYLDKKRIYLDALRTYKSLKVIHDSLTEPTKQSQVYVAMRYNLDLADRMKTAYREYQNKLNN